MPLIDGMKKSTKIVLLVILALFLLLVVNLVFIIYNFSHNLNDGKNLNIYNCAEDSFFVEDCILEHLKACNPATNDGGIVIIKQEKDTCKVMLRNSEQDMGYKCNLKMDDLNFYSQEENMLNLLSNLDSNKDCDKITFGSMLFTRIWK